MFLGRNRCSRRPFLAHSPVPKNVPACGAKQVALARQKCQGFLQLSATVARLLRRVGETRASQPQSRCSYHDSLLRFTLGTNGGSGPPIGAGTTPVLRMNRRKESRHVAYESYGALLGKRRRHPAPRRTGRGEPARRPRIPCPEGHHHRLRTRRTLSPPTAKEPSPSCTRILRTKFTTVETVKTRFGARTATLDAKTHDVLLVTGHRGHGPDAPMAEGNSFVVLVVGK